MDDLDRQKRLTFVLQLLEDLLHFHGSSIHKCFCEICDKKSSLIKSSIVKAIEEVNKVFKSLFFQDCGPLPGELSSQADENRVTGYFQEIDSLSRVPSGVCESKTTTSHFHKPDRKSAEFNHSHTGLSKLKEDDVDNHVKVANSETSSSMLSSTYRDSGVHCENLLQSHSISPIRSVVDEVKQNDNEISPNYSSAGSSIPATRSKSNSPNSVASELDIRSRQTVVSNTKQNLDISDIRIKEANPVTAPKAVDQKTFTSGEASQSMTTLSPLFPVSPILCHQFPTPIFPASSQQTSPVFGWVPAKFYPSSLSFNSQNVQKVGLINTDHMDSSPFSIQGNLEVEQHQHPQAIGKLQSQANAMVESEETPQKDDDVFTVGELFQKMPMPSLHQNKQVGNDHLSLPVESGTKAISNEDVCEGVHVDIVEKIEDNNFSSNIARHGKGDPEYCQISRNDSIVHNRNVLLSDARLSSDEDRLKEGESQYSSNSDVDSFRLSDSYMWRPWEVKDDIYRIISDSSIGEEDEDDVEPCSREKEEVEAVCDLEFRSEDENGGPIDGHVLSNKEVNKKERRDSNSAIDIDENVSEGHLLLSPCKKTRASLRVHMLSESEDSQEGTSCAALKSPSSNVQNEQSDDSACDDSVLSFVDDTLPEASNSNNVSLSSTTSLPDEMNVDFKSRKNSLETGTFSSCDGNEVICAKNAMAPRLSNHNSQSGESPGDRHSSKTKTGKMLRCRQTLFRSPMAGQEGKENVDGLKKSSPPSIEIENILSDGDLKEDVRVMRDVSIMTLNRRNLLCEKKENVNVEVDLKSQHSMNVPELIFNNVATVENEKVLDLTVNRKDECKLSVPLERNRNGDKSILGLVANAKTESHSFCNIPNNNQNELWAGHVHANLNPSLSKKGRLTMKTFPPKHKTKQVFVKSTQDQVKLLQPVEDKKTQENCCVSRTIENNTDLHLKTAVRTSPKLVGPLAWGAPAVLRSLVREGEGDLDKSQKTGAKKDNAHDTGTGETDNKLLWERFGELRLEKESSHLNKSLPVKKSSKLQQHEAQSLECCEFEANQSFPRMAKGELTDTLTAGRASPVSGRSVGTQNLALGDVYQTPKSTPSELKVKNTGLAPRNRRSVFGFSPPNGVGIESTVAPNPVQQPDSTALSPPLVPDKLWSDFDTSEYFPRSPVLEEVLFNSVSSCICVVDTSKQGKIVSINEAFQQLVGIHEKVLGLKLSRFIKVRAPLAELAVSTPHQVILSDGSLTPVPGKMVSCITSRGEEIPVSIWSLPCLSPNDEDGPTLTVCVISLALPLPDGFYVTKCGQVTFENCLTAADVKSQSLTPCRAATQTGLLVVNSDGGVEAWDSSYFNLFLGQCDFKKKEQLSKYLSEVVKISDCDDDSVTSSRQSPAAGTQVSPLLPNRISSQFGGDVCFLRESNDTLCGNNHGECAMPSLLLPASCFLMGEDDDIDDEDVSSEDGGMRIYDRDGPRLEPEETSVSKEAAGVDSYKQTGIASIQRKGALPTTSTPCKSEGLAEAALDTATSKLFTGNDNKDDDDEGGGDVEMGRGIYSARFHSQCGDWFDVTFKLGCVQTKGKGTLFCLWFSTQEESTDGGDGDDDDGDDRTDYEDDISDIEVDDDSFRSDEAVNERMDNSEMAVDRAKKRLFRFQNGVAGEMEETDVSLGQFITDRAGLNQSLNVTVGEDTLDLEQAVSGSFSNNYRILETLGQGSFGFVRRAFTLSDEANSVVVKFIKKSSMLEESRQCQTSEDEPVPMEVAMLQSLDHDNIVKLLDVHQNEQFVQLVMEDFASLDLFDFIDQVTVDETLACHLFKQITQAVDYLHSKSILHRDIKDENVIINDLFHCKLIDFGSATYFLPPGQFFEKFRGTMEYCSPEVHVNHRYRGPELDAWALGVTLFTIIYRENPFGADLVPHQLTAEHLPHPVSGDLTAVLFGLLCCNPDERFSVAKALASPWLRQDIDLSSYKWDDLFANPDDNVEY